MKSFIRNVIENPDNPEELMLDLGNEVCDELGWKEGDVVEWIDNKDGTWTLRKKTIDSKS
jgi:hypothetical protein